jgi:hypothetical protein
MELMWASQGRLQVESSSSRTHQKREEGRGSESARHELVHLMQIVSSPCRGHDLVNNPMI